MSDNILQTLQHLVQDVIAPDVRELKANQAASEKQIAALERHMDFRFVAADQKNDARFNAIEARFNAIEARFNAIEARFDAIDARLDTYDKKSDAQFNALLSAISESRAQAELTNLASSPPSANA